MKLLIIGCNGQLGRDLMQQVAVRGWQAAGADLPACDITDARSVRRTLAAAGGPDALINAAAYTAVDQAENQAQTAFAVNRDGVEVLARACRDADLPMLHVSTDYVFDGLKKSPYLPSDPVAPQGVYGQSKADGEERLRQTWDRHAIVRTSWLFGVHGPNFVKTVLRLAKERDTLRIVDDQVGCPTYAGDLAAALLEISACLVRQKEGWGTYHFCNRGPVTWYAFTRRVLEAAADYEPFKVKEILPIPTSHYPTPARRPAYSVLDCSSLDNRFAIRRRSWEAALEEMLAEIYRPQARS